MYSNFRKFGNREVCKHSVVFSKVDFFYVDPRLNSWELSSAMQWVILGIYLHQSGIIGSTVSFGLYGQIAEVAFFNFRIVLLVFSRINVLLC